MLDYTLYRKLFFANPQPPARFGFIGIRGIAWFFEELGKAVEFYGRVLGPPGYREGRDTFGWRLGDTWLTLLQAEAGSPQNAEITVYMSSPEEAERLQRAFIEAGGEGEPPSDQLMYEPLRYCSVTDPFGGRLSIVSSLPPA